MPESIIDISHAFFNEVVHSILAREFPAETAHSDDPALKPFALMGALRP